MSMSDEVRAEYEAALARVVVRNGSIVRTNDTYYGWNDYPAFQHIVGGSWGDKGPGCALVLPDGARAVEDEWSEFAGTFADGDNVKHGAIVRGVSCKCGQLTGRSVRWEANMHEVAEAVFEEALGARKNS